MKYSIVFTAVVAALTLSACDRSADVTPTAAIAAPASSPRMSIDPSIPTVTSTPSTESPTSARDNANPQGEMTKQEESVAMPLPGQANDHSSPALHPAK